MALGAKLAAPEKQVICFEGDGGLMCGILSELEVGARYNLGMPVVVFNNGTLLHEKKRMHGPLAEEMDFSSGIDFAMIARGLKCEGIRVERPEEIRPALERALTNRRTPTVVDVVLDPDVNFPAGE
jgi:acetolactate synthase I/II/III large subunit